MPPSTLHEGIPISSSGSFVIVLTKFSLPPSLFLSLSPKQTVNMYEKFSSPHSKQRNKYTLQGHSMSLVLVLLAITCLTNGAESKSPSSHIPVESKAGVVSACKDTPYQAACEYVLLSSSSTSMGATAIDDQTPGELFDRLVHFSMGQAQAARALTHNVSLLYQKAQTHLVGGMDDCVELLDDTLDQLTNVLNYIKTPIAHNPHHVQTWLSTALTNQETCLESLNNHYYFEQDKGIKIAKAQNLSHFISNSLAVYMSSAKSKEDKESILARGGGGGGGRRLLSAGGFPRWLSASERRLLEASIGEMAPSAVVSKDGSGTHNRIGEALRLVVSLAGEGRTVIHIKAGTYHENLKIPTHQKNVMLVGDGKGMTVIVGDRNSEDGWTTFQSATFGAMGDGFMARDITFVNSAGPAKHQAVALRVGSDRSVIFRCSIFGYQDTLYTLSKRQFYRETDIYGTVDFIFGNSAVVFQSCNIYARKPVGDQKNFITAQGRSDPNQNTGISIHNCKIAASSDLAPAKSQTPTFLGRPWKKYARTVIMQSFLDDSIHPLGWSPWSGSSAPNTVYYGEYMNSGPGASTSGRVKWPSYHAAITVSEAQTFSVGSFISGNLWLPSTGVPFDSGLVA